MMPPSHIDSFTFLSVNCLHKFSSLVVGLLLLATSSQPIGDPYERSGSIMELRWEGRGLSVTVKPRGAE